MKVESLSNSTRTDSRNDSNEDSLSLSRHGQHDKLGRCRSEQDLFHAKLAQCDILSWNTELEGGLQNMPSEVGFTREDSAGGGGV
jgi:hypothetical protein